MTGQLAQRRITISAASANALAAGDHLTVVAELRE